VKNAQNIGKLPNFYPCLGRRNIFREKKFHQVKSSISVDVAAVQIMISVAQFANSQKISKKSTKTKTKNIIDLFCGFLKKF
jgi:hypothetical protein